MFFISALMIQMVIPPIPKTYIAILFMGFLNVIIFMLLIGIKGRIIPISIYRIPTIVILNDNQLICCKYTPVTANIFRVK